MDLPAWLQLVLILLPLASRELVHWRAVSRTAKPANGTRHGGQASVVIWNLVYLTLLAFAIVAIVGGPWRGSSIGIALVWVGAALRASAYHALGEHYAVT